MSSENQSVEHSLLKTIIEFLQYSYQFQVDQQKLVPTNTPAIFSNVFLIHLRQWCVVVVVIIVVVAYNLAIIICITLIYLLVIILLIYNYNIVMV